MNNEKFVIATELSEIINFNLSFVIPGLVSEPASQVEEAGEGRTDRTSLQPLPADWWYSGAIRIGRRVVLAAEPVHAFGLQL